MNGKEEYIPVKDGLDVLEIRKFLDVTNTMVRCINREECDEILTIYYKVTERLLKEKNKIIK